MIDNRNPQPSTTILAGIRRKIKVVAFDCDGVLFDSKEANIRFYDHILDHFGAPGVSPEQEQFVHMYSAGDSLRYLLGDDSDLLERAWEYSRSLDFMQFNEYLSLEPGLLEALEASHAAFCTALATNRTVSAHAVLEHFGLLRYFHAIVTAADVARPKPEPDMMNKILRTFSVSPQQVLFIGDSRVDEQFAVNTGVRFAAYKNPDLRADLHIRHFDQLRPLFSNRRARRIEANAKPGR